MTEETKNIKWMVTRFARPGVWVPYLLFIALLSIPYIYLSHRSDNQLREIERLRKANKELRAEYITIKSELMRSSRQSAVAEKLENQGLILPDNAPEKIEVE